MDVLVLLLIVGGKSFAKLHASFTLQKESPKMCLPFFFFAVSAAQPQMKSREAHESGFTIQQHLSFPNIPTHQFFCTLESADGERSASCAPYSFKTSFKKKKNNTNSVLWSLFPEKKAPNFTHRKPVFACCKSFFHHLNF